MLILTRRIGQTITIGDDVTVKVVDIRGSQVRVGVDAPRTTEVHREEIREQIRQERERQAAQRESTATERQQALVEDCIAMPAHPLRAEPEALKDAILALSAEHRSMLRLILAAAPVGFMTLLPSEHRLREQQISLCDQLDRALSRSLAEIDHDNVNEVRRSGWTTLRDSLRQEGIAATDG